MKATLSCWDDQETHAASTAWLMDGTFHEGQEDPDSADSATSALATGLADRPSGPAAPARRRGGDSIFQSLMRLWPRDGRRPGAASIRTMARLRAAFRACLADLMQAARAREEVEVQQRLEALLRHIVHARHPQDLWHLRAAVFTEVARAASQAEAQRRLALLNQQFDDSRGRLKQWLGRD